MLITSSSFTSTARPLASFLPLSLYSTNRVAIGLPDLVLSEVRHDVTTRAVQRDVNLRLVVLVLAGGGVGDMVTGQDHAFVQRNGLTFAVSFTSEVTRNTARSGSRLVNVGCSPDGIPACSGAQNLFRARGVLNTRQFYNDTVST